MQSSGNTKKAQDAKLHFLDYWRIIRIRKTVILTVFLLVVLTTTVVTYFINPTYSSTVRIAIEKDTSDIAPLIGFRPAAQYDPYWIQTQFEKIQSRSVLHPVIMDPDLNLQEVWADRYKRPSLTTNEMYQVLKKSIDVEQGRNTSVIEITVYSEQKEEAAKIANKIAQTYKQQRVNNQMDLSKAGIKELEKQEEAQKEKIRAAQAEVDKLKVDLGVPDISLADSGVFTSTTGPQIIAKLDAAKTDAEITLAQHSALHDSLAALEEEDFRKAALSAMPGNRRLSVLIERYDEIVRGLDSGGGAALGPEHPSMYSLEKEKKTLEKQLQEELDGIMIALKQSVDKYKLMVASLESQIEKAKMKEAENTEKFRPYFTAKRELEGFQKFLEAIRARKLQETVDSNLPKTSIVEIYDPAQPALKQVSPKLGLNVALGVLIGLVVGVGLAFFIEYLDTSVKTIDDVEQALGSPVLGVIPQNVSSLLEEGPDSPHAEAYRVLRTNVLFSRKSEDITTMTVVSGGAGEGKSTTIFNLATIFAQNNNKVLVVDSDLRRPSLHKIIGVSNANGLTNYLMNDVRLDEVIQTTKLSTLDFLPSGKLPSSSLGILNSPQMKTFVKDVKSRYDFVFFDSPPIMGVSDASILASEVDMALLVIQYRKYPQAMTVRAKQMVEKVGGNLLGVVLNNINIFQDSYYYYYSGYYYDYYEKSNIAKEDKKENDKNGDPKTGKTTRRPELVLKKKY